MNSILHSLIRFAAFGFTAGVAMIAFLGVFGIVGLTLPILIGSMAGVGCLVLFLWGGTRLVGHLIYGDDPDYREWCRNRDPWFETLPPPFRANNDHAPYSCLKCGGEMKSSTGMCPSCGFGKNEMACLQCGLFVAQPFERAFETTGVRCPQCENVLSR